MSSVLLRVLLGISPYVGFMLFRSNDGRKNLTMLLAQVLQI